MISTFPTLNCTAGYYCPSGSSSATQIACSSGYACPVGTAQQVVCPTGYSCLGQIPTICPAGTFCPNTMMLNPSPCSNGYYCATPGLSIPTGLCKGGYWCVAQLVLGASVPDPTDGTIGAACTAGYFCPPGASAPLICQPGTFCNTTALSAGHPCTPGFYCPTLGMNANPTQQCPTGTYCTAGLSTCCETK
jgi:hypothetical protein